jgi:ABC-type nitrate/sulfonate/bicarbonate transport system permease component
MKRWQRAWIDGLSVVLFLILWEIAMPLGLVKVSDISRPSLVVKSFLELAAEGEIWPHLFISLEEFVIGFLLALVVGIPLGIVIGRYRLPGLLLDPLLMALYTMPRMAMMPLLVVWFGVGVGATVSVVFLGSVFPIIINTTVGIREIDPVWVRAVRSFGGSEWDIFKKVLLPGAVPAMMSGIRLGVGRGILGVVVSEMYASTAGIGGQIAIYGNSFRTTELITLITIVSLLGFFAVDIMRRFEEWIRKGRVEV